jgi:cation-transporting ATPase E
VTALSPTSRVGGAGALLGLTREEVARRIADGRSNDVPVVAARSMWEIVRANVFTRFNAIIGVLFATILVVGPVQDGLFGLVIVVNTGIGIVQEIRAKHTLEHLAILSESRPRVWRDGALVELAPRQLVVDDLVVLGPGDEIVVDGDVFAAEGLEIDESLLTGESDPVRRVVGEPVLSGAFVVAGAGIYRATRVGREAYAARLAEEASRFTLATSELRRGVDSILRIITYLMVPAGVLIAISQFTVEDRPTRQALRGTVAALVPMVPEGLVLLTSLAFAVAVVRLGRRQCLVQELPAIEALARVDVVCTDKTGTLTENGMRLARVLPVGSRSTAEVDRVLAPPRRVVPFSSARKWSGAGFDDLGEWVLGAPDVLLPPNDPIRAEAERVGATGLRVLLVGQLDRPVDAADAPGPVQAAALVVLEQRIRPEAGPALRFFESQGVALKVVSGDNAASVGAVAASLGVAGAAAPRDARELPNDRAGLAVALEEANVFGRVTPSQKREMVAALQTRGHIVAMTGDGVNDVLALKDADIGVAMGAGSPAARAVAQIVLLDNSFATLPHVVAEGRRVIGNVERVANLFLTKTVYSVLLAVVIGVLHIPFPFLPRHLTLVGSLTIGIPAFFLALAPNADRARPGFVRHALRLAVPSGVIAGLCTAVAYLLVRQQENTTELQQSTAAVLTLFLVSLWVLVVVARPFLWWKVLVVALAVLAFAVSLTWGPAQRFWEFDPHHVAAMWTAAGVALVGCALIEVSARLIPAVPG